MDPALPVTPVLMRPDRSALRREKMGVRPATTETVSPLEGVEMGRDSCLSDRSGRLAARYCEQSYRRQAAAPPQHASARRWQFEERLK
jgi:hypothetical protein